MPFNIALFFKICRYTIVYEKYLKYFKIKIKLFSLFLYFFTKHEFSGVQIFFSFQFEQATFSDPLSHLNSCRPLIEFRNPYGIMDAPLMQSGCENLKLQFSRQLGKYTEQIGTLKIY